MVGVDGIDARVTNGHMDSGGIDLRVPGIGGVDDGKGGVGGGGHGRGGGGGGGGDGEEEAGEEVDIAAEGRLREKIVKRVDKAVRKGKVSCEAVFVGWMRMCCIFLQYIVYDCAR